MQASRVDPEALEGWSPQPVKRRNPGRALGLLARRLFEARRPVLVGGEGVREAGAVEEFRGLAARLRVPVVTAWMPDLYPPDQLHYAGRMRALGTRFEFGMELAAEHIGMVAQLGNLDQVPVGRLPAIEQPRLLE